MSLVERVARIRTQERAWADDVRERFDAAHFGSALGRPGSVPVILAEQGVGGQEFIG
ncbi:hypothetical protein D3C87_1827670 [compost metagenome]